MEVEEDMFDVVFGDDTPRNDNPDEEERKEEDPTDSYWWREEDESVLAAHLQNKFDEFHSFVRVSTFFSWCRKSWLYYYKMAFSDGADNFNAGVQMMGDEGELVAAQINHLRNFVQHRINLVTKDRPALICRARNTDTESQIQTEFGQGLVDYYLQEHGIEDHARTCVEHAIVFAEGFLVMTWDPMEGEIYDADSEGELEYKGDIRIENPISWNVIRDTGIRDWRKSLWVGVRRPMNKFDLLARYGKNKDHAIAINGAERWSDVPLEEGARPFDDDRYFLDSDEIETYEFWHRRSPAMPSGRYLLICNGAVLQDEDFDYDRIPVYKLAVSNLILSSFSYSPIFDMIPIQELLNNCISTIATNQNAHGVQSVWKKAGGTLRVSEILSGMQLVESDEKPEALQLTQTPAEVYSFAGELIRHGEQIMGIDQVTRGYTDANVRSAEQAALIQSQSVQFTSALQGGYYKLLEEIGTNIIRLMQEFATQERVLTIVGKHSQPYTRQWTSDDLTNIERVTVETTNPMFNTYAGKLEWAKMVASTGMLKTPEELLNVFRTGNADSMLEADRAQLNLVREENEMLLQAQEIPDAAPEENHILHIREHMAILGSIEAKSDPELRSAVLAHVMGHQTLLLSDPNTQMLQTMLGYSTPMPPGAAPAGSNAPTASPLGNQTQPGSNSANEVPQGPGGPEARIQQAQTQVQ